MIDKTATMYSGALCGDYLVLFNEETAFKIHFTVNGKYHRNLHWKLYCKHLVVRPCKYKSYVEVTQGGLWFPIKTSQIEKHGE